MVGFSLPSSLLSDRSSAYFVSLGLEDEKATKLPHHYYTEYGLALRGLVRHHEVGKSPSPLPYLSDAQLFSLFFPCSDPIDFDRKCDGSLPLEQIIKPDPALRKLLEDIDRSKVRVWALTNAYKPVRVPIPLYCLRPNPRYSTPSASSGCSTSRTKSTG